MERLWVVASGLCLVAAAVFLWRAQMDAAFVAATLGVVAWFLGLRDRLRKTVITAGDPPPAAESNDIGDQDED
ncbi:MAG: hypothetical protein WCF57_21255 [Pyrinomonadaceae bacterium]